VADQARAAPADPRGTPRLAEVLAGSPSSDEINLGEVVEIGDVAEQLDSRKASSEHSLRRSIPLAQKPRTMPGDGQAALDAANSGEQPSNAESPAGRHASPSSTRVGQIGRTGVRHGGPQKRGWPSLLSAGGDQEPAVVVPVVVVPVLGAGKAAPAGMILTSCQLPVASRLVQASWP
jgi:hypothetical protein